MDQPILLSSETSQVPVDGLLLPTLEDCLVLVTRIPKAVAPIFYQELLAYLANPTLPRSCVLGFIRKLAGQVRHELEKGGLT